MPQKNKGVLLPERFAFSGVFSISLIFYTLTLAPTVTLELSGSMITAADSLGVANSPGYPVWTLLAWLFQWMFGFATYHGHPNPAWGVNFMSAFFGAASNGLVAWLVSRTSRDSGCRVSVFVIGGISAGFLFGFSPFLWSQSVIAEMVTLNVFTVLLFLCLVYLGIIRQDGRYLYPLSFLLGIGYLNSPTFVLMIPIYAAACLRLGSWKEWPVLIGLVALGLLPLIYIPLASAQNPPINWGYARTPAGFLHQIARGQYEKLMFSNSFSPLYAHQMLAYGKILLWQFTTPVLLLAIFSVFLLKRKEMRFWSLILVLATFMYTAVLTAGMNPSLDIQTLFIGRVLWIPSYSIIAILIGFGLSALLEFASRQSRFVFCLACLTAILISFAPWTSNFDPEFIQFFGGSEQSWLNE